LGPQRGPARQRALQCTVACARPAGRAAARHARDPSITAHFRSLPVFISNAYAQAAPAAPGADLASTFTSMLPLVLMFVVLYFIMIRPQMKKQKEHRAMIDALAKGDEVVTAGGLMGRVTALSEGQIGLQIASGVEVQMQRSAIVQVLPKGTLK